MEILKYPKLSEGKFRGYSLCSEHETTSLLSVCEKAHIR